MNSSMNRMLNFNGKNFKVISKIKLEKNNSDPMTTLESYPTRSSEPPTSCPNPTNCENEAVFNTETCICECNLTPRDCSYVNMDLCSCEYYDCEYQWNGIPYSCPAGSTFSIRNC